MSLATRCIACGTVFRVVQDQLKVSEGWVRCGRCEMVFNALEGLFDLERESPPPWPPSEAPVAEPPLPPPTAAPHVPPATGLETQPLQQGEASAAIEAPDSEQPTGFEDARFNSELHGDSAPAPGDTVADTVVDTVVESSSDSVAEPPVVPAAEPAPFFIRQAERDAQWRRPRVRAGLAVLSLLFALLLVAQAVVHFRDGLAAHWPESRPTIEWLCTVADCRIEPLRRVENLAVDSSGLTRLNGANGGGALYRFSIALRNRGTTTVMLPAIDLSLTDAQGQLVARKVVTAAELGATQGSLAAGADVALSGLLAAGERRIVGYTVEIFYP